ncbi:hypothetical protein SNOG_15396 [Parastagonospora nodorum SN15]|uniref:Uncharacterized protein n=1 Tax=Phaeosphaeria nodorum (strain SN15 / ATCC MYA-4574 / FGSC 10173) TaxID=321614 RepID=Q0TYX8_PHANO|nr:hypothetical protein SNOG_15396 [Parastagonospora nodorum SN15]EAT77329.1 hypothetical protein SNOG_15396 [Parastagonospora nodorum SN15]
MHPHTKGLNRHTNKHGYTVPDITYKDPNNRRLRVVTIGTGFSGVLLAYKLKNETENVEHVMLPSHSYTYNFALNVSPEFCRVIEAKWSEDDSRWDLKIEQSYADETKKIVYDHCMTMESHNGKAKEW